jgi:hypothetical protein
VTLAGLGAPGLAGLVLAPMLALVIRPGAVLTSLVRSGQTRPERLLVGRLGVRGIGSPYHASAAFGPGAFGKGEARTLFRTVAVAAIVSIDEPVATVLTWNVAGRPSGGSVCSWLHARRSSCARRPRSRSLSAISSRARCTGAPRSSCTTSTHRSAASRSG